MRQARALLGQGPKLHGIQAHSINSGGPLGGATHLQTPRGVLVKFCGFRLLGSESAMAVRLCRAVCSSACAGMKRVSGQLDSMRRGLAVLTGQLQKNGLQQASRRAPVRLACPCTLSWVNPLVKVKALQLCGGMEAGEAIEGFCACAIRQGQPEGRWRTPYSPWLAQPFLKAWLSIPCSIQLQKTSPCNSAQRQTTLALSHIAPEVAPAGQQ